MDEKQVVLLSITAGEQSGIEIQIHGGEDNKVLLLGLLEQVKYDLLSGKKPDSSFDTGLTSSQYDA